MTNKFCRRASAPACAFSGKRRAILTGFVSVPATLFISQAGAFRLGKGTGLTKGTSFVEQTDLNPDRMWPVYRRYHLIIVGQRDDEKGLTLTKASTDTLAQFLPESRALLVRAADMRRIGVLIATDQQDVAVISAEGAKALFLGEPNSCKLPNWRLDPAWPATRGGAAPTRNIGAAPAAPRRRGSKEAQPRVRFYRAYMTAGRWRDGWPLGVARTRRQSWPQLESPTDDHRSSARISAGVSSTSYTWSLPK